MARYTTCSCVFHFLNRAEFVLTIGENLLSQRTGLPMNWAQSPFCLSAVVACSTGELSPQSALKGVLCSPPSRVLSLAKAGWIAWCNHGPYHWSLGLFPALCEAQIVHIPIGMFSFWAFGDPPTMPHYLIIGYSFYGDVWHFRNIVRCQFTERMRNESPSLWYYFDLLAL